LHGVGVGVAVGVGVGVGVELPSSFALMTVRVAVDAAPVLMKMAAATKRVRNVAR
jgi:hypothetical protein